MVVVGGMAMVRPNAPEVLILSMARLIRSRFLRVEGENEWVNS